jgi:hypothetical protein
MVVKHSYCFDHSASSGSAFALAAGELPTSPSTGRQRTVRRVQLPESEIAEAQRHTRALLDAGEPRKALKFVEQLPSGDPNAVQVRAFAEIDGGELLADPGVVPSRRRPPRRA